MTSHIDITNSAVQTLHCDDTDYTFSVDEGNAARILRCSTHAQVVEVPEMLDNYPVAAIAHSAFAALDRTETLVLPSSVTQIGWSAFANCGRLRKIVLPEQLDHVDKTWLSGCDQLTDIVLPGRVKEIDAEFLKSCKPVRLVLGKDTESIDVPPFWAASLREIAVDSQNSHLSTDGQCLYSHDGSVLIRCLVESESYCVREGCRVIAPKAFAYNMKLRAITLPDTVEVIEQLAFLNTSLEQFQAPAQLRVISQRAFVRCSELVDIQLNEGLEQLGDSPFFQCEKLEHVRIPASVQQLGQSPLAGTALVATGEHPTFSIAEDNPYLFLEEGMLYQQSSRGQVLSDALDDHVHVCHVHADTKIIGEGAFSGHKAIQHVVLPFGCKEISSNAFASCDCLKRVDIPESLESIGTRAFFNSPIEELFIPAGLVRIGSCALAGDYSENHATGKRRPSLRTVQVQAGNERFFMEQGMLCERVADYVRVVRYIGPDTNITLPREITEIGSYAFAGVTGLQRLFLHRGITHIATMGFAMDEPPRLVEVEVDAADSQETEVMRLRPVCDQYGMRAWRNAFGEGVVNVRLLMDGMDRAALYLRDRISRIQYIVRRLDDPCLLSSGMRSNFELTLQRSLAPLCVVIAEYGWHEGFEMLIDLEYLNSETITDVIDAVNAAGHVASTAFLLGLKDERLHAQNDYSL